MSLRTDRVASVIKEEVGTLLARDFNDPSYGLMTVTEVHVTPDLRLAKIYVSILGDEDVRERTMKMLEKNTGAIRASIGSHVRLKFTPSVVFYIDETLDRVEKISRIIKHIHDGEGGGTSR